jgi:hypothetical protein
MATYITDDALLNAVAARVGYTADKITAESHLPAIVSDANISAYQTIRSKLMGRGYSASTIDTWERAAEFNRRIGICHTLTEWALTKEFDSNALDRLCKCEEELDTVILVEADDDTPEISQANVTYGDMGTTDDRFSLDTDL